MSSLVQLYLILAGTMFVALLIVIMKIAGKDILFAFYRWSQPKGCDIFMVDNNKQVSHYYKKMIDGSIFKIDGQTYITNPNKLLGLTDDMVQDVQKKMDKKIKNLMKNIETLEVKRDLLIKQAKSLENTKENMPLLDQALMQITDMNNKIELLRSKLNDKEQNYYMNRRACYIYIKGDPIPKDMFEFYTEIDCTQLENVILRAQTKDPEGAKDLEKNIIWIKKFVIIAAILGGIAAFLAFRNSSFIEQVAQHMGVVFN